MPHHDYVYVKHLQLLSPKGLIKKKSCVSSSFYLIATHLSFVSCGNDLFSSASSVPKTKEGAELTRRSLGNLKKKTKTKTQNAAPKRSSFFWQPDANCPPSPPSFFPHFFICHFFFGRKQGSTFSWQLSLQLKRSFFVQGVHKKGKDKQHFLSGVRCQQDCERLSMQVCLVETKGDSIIIIGLLIAITKATETSSRDTTECCNWWMCFRILSTRERLFAINRYYLQQTINTMESPFIFNGTAYSITALAALSPCQSLQSIYVNDRRVFLPVSHLHKNHDITSETFSMAHRSPWPTLCIVNAPLRRTIGTKLHI